MGSASPAVIDLETYQDWLYAGAGWGEAAGQLWRSSDGTT